MGIVQMNNNGSVTGELAELNNHMLGDQKKIRDGVTGEGQELSEEDESQINENVEDVREGRVEAIQVPSQDFLQRPQQQRREPPVVRWEKFLPLRSLKVLLVEHDDSTRHVVSALLRNCGYEVMAVANGLQAWKILEDLTSHIDLVLTEVEPCLSGIALLYKIMSHKTRKNVPVIMMSSYDSMGIVFKCLSKGAVDFLVKPIRKNELKNLWQHIWRRCHSSSGSGSESGIRTQKSIKSKSVEENDNNTGSNDEGDIRCIGVNVRNGSDNGSGTQQSSWTKRAVEVDSPQPQSPWDQSEPQDSTCAQVVLPRPEAISNNLVPVTNARECKEQDDKLDEVVMGKDLEIGVPRIPKLQREDPGEIILTNEKGTDKGKFHEVNSKEGYGHLEKGEQELNSEKLTCESRNQAGTYSSNPHIGSEDVGNQNGSSKVSSIKDTVIYASKEMPSLELSLKRQRDVGDAGTPAYERNVLRHSDLSAFTRYNSASAANQTLMGNVDSCSPVDNSSEAAAKTDSMHNFQSNSNISPPNQRSNGSSNNNDMGSTTNDVFTTTAEFADKLGPKSTVKSPHPSAGFQPIQDSHVTAPQPMVPGKPETAVADIVLGPAGGKRQQFQVRHHHHHYHHHHHHVHNMKEQQQQQQQLDDNVDLSLETMTEEAPKSGSSNKLNAPIIGDACNYSINVSATGSNHGSNGQNMSSAILNAEGTANKCDNEVAVEGGSDGGIGFRLMTEVDQSRITPREAALQKFRQKRKERCFEKKVRYHSRQKLAEQRPRIRGQFVRQVVLDNNQGKDTLS